MYKVFDEKNRKKIGLWLAIVILFILPLLKINIGIDITDTGYSLGNFENMPEMSGMWVIAIYLSNILGYFFTLLPFGHTMMGMNFYTGLMLSAILVFSFLFLRKTIPTSIVFVGEILAFSLCWCPTPILYNYFTYLVMTVALYFLYKGLLSEKSKFLIIAGCLLGVNVFVRFPNLVEVGFIVIVWYDAFLQKKGWKKGIYDTFKCIIGYLIGFGAIFLIALLNYGLNQYIGMLKSLMNIGTDIQGYGPMSMVTRVLKEYIEHIKWIWMAILCILIVQFIYSKIKNMILKIITCVFGGFLFAGIFVYYYKNGLFSKTGYNSYSSMYFWGMLFLLISLFSAIFLLIKKDAKREIRLLAATSLMVLIITPLGTNNMVYSNFNNLFLVAPITFYTLHQYVLRKELRKKYLPAQVAIFAVLAIVMVQCFLFKTVFTFRDVGLTKELNTKISQNEVLKGMKTSAARADILEDMWLFVDKNRMQNREVVVFGSAPAIPYMLQLKPALTSTWPDLPSYSYEEFACSLRQTKEPLVIINTLDYPDIKGCREYALDEKAALLAGFLIDNKYELVYKNKEFEIYDMQ